MSCEILARSETMNLTGKNVPSSSATLHVPCTLHFLLTLQVIAWMKANDELATEHRPRSTFKSPVHEVMFLTLLRTDVADTP